MKPILISRHTLTEGPGFLADFLDKQELPWQLLAIDAGEAVPTDISRYSGLVLMGGPMSVNDPLPWISQLLDLIKQAIAADIPVLGHCLGGQLMAKALGGEVSKNSVKEIGWGEVAVQPHPEAARWFGKNRVSFLSFHWHGETFSIPSGATSLLTSRFCANQAFSMRKHLGLQCHIEMTEELINAWCKVGEDEIFAHLGPSVQAVAEMKQDLFRRLPALHQVAEQVYTEWIKGIAVF